MTDDYTPTTEDVREDFAFPWSPEQIGDRPARVAAFDRWLAAHDAEVRDGVVAEEPEWEYGIAYAPGNEEFEGQDLPTIQRRVKYIRRQGGYYSRTVRAMRRRPAGESAPVEQEGEPDGPAGD